MIKKKNFGAIPVRKEILRHFDQNDSLMAEVIRRIGPMKLKRNRNYFVVLCKAIIAQQISVAAADTITGRFYTLFKILHFCIFEKSTIFLVYYTFSQKYTFTKPDVNFRAKGETVENTYIFLRK